MLTSKPILLRTYDGVAVSFIKLGTLKILFFLSCMCESMSQSIIFSSQDFTNSITSSCGQPSSCLPKVSLIPLGMVFWNTFVASNEDTPVSPTYFLLL